MRIGEYRWGLSNSTKLTYLKQQQKTTNIFFPLPLATTQPRVTREQDAIRMELVAPRLPVCTGSLHLCESVRSLDLGLAFQELDAKTSGNMEGNVAVHEPCTWVVRLESKDQVAIRGKISRIAADGVVGLQSGNVTVPDCVLFLAEDVEVMAVKVDGVRQRWVAAILLDDPILPLEPLLITGQ